MMFLPDINLWLALSFQVHAHHVAAKPWFDGLTAGVFGFWRLSQQGFLRLASNPRVFGDDAVSLAEAWRLYDRILVDPRVVFHQEPQGLEGHWRALTQGPTFSPNFWNDAYLAAFSQSAGLQLVTFDKGFRQFNHLDYLVLT